jgi:hypothetical protein
MVVHEGSSFWDVEQHVLVVHVRAWYNVYLAAASNLYFFCLQFLFLSKLTRIRGCPFSFSEL